MASCEDRRFFGIGHNNNQAVYIRTWDGCRRQKNDRAKTGPGYATPRQAADHEAMNGSSSSNLQCLRNRGEKGQLETGIPPTGRLALG